MRRFARWSRRPSPATPEQTAATRSATRPRRTLNAPTNRRIPAMNAYLIDNPPRVQQFRPRRDKVTGLIVVHTAESFPDETDPDTGTVAVARFIENRTTPGCYHAL